MQTQTSRRAFCAGTIAFAVSPSISLLASPAPSVSDAKILAAVAAWMDLTPILDAISDRREYAFDASRAAVGECPMGDYEANRVWHDAWDKTPCGLLEAEWDRVAAIADGHLTYATNTRAVTPDGVEAKIRLYRAVLDFYGEDGDEDGIMLERIERDISLLSIAVEV